MKTQPIVFGKDAAPAPAQTYKGQANDEQIAEWKKLYPQGIYAIRSADGFIAYFRNPGIAEMNYATSKLTQEAPLDYNKYVLDATGIGGEIQAIINDDERFKGAQLLLKEKLEGTKCELVNL